MHLMIDVLKKKTYVKLLGNLQSQHTLIFIPPATSQCTMIETFVKEQFKKYKCILFDLPAHGLSEGTSYQTIEAYGRWTVALLQALVKQGQLARKNYIVGYSMGALIGFEVAMQQLPFIHGLISISGAASVKGHNAIEDYIEQFSRENFTPLQVFNAGNPSRPFQKIEAAHEPIVKSLATSPVCYDDLLAVSKYNAIERVDMIRIPVLLFVGEKDKMFEPSCIYTTYRELRGLGSIKAIQNGSHALIFSVPKVLAKTINEWMGGK